ncbi:tRNA pseudouridine(55) synthase TruB [Peptoniphilus stercorisuis]|uniref:tRNA pseudouridine synthase B n=1 Tax=Peptoniphilus stercorisuis TaxID=1436965 RepID=A0ABS4KCI3_9FIRM|nr:tRNA pseudouridine(55) synthase TruB [Peptoniphilus stercorisuis]MBP2025496.1 tRNA pseudouridine55 synthase [Peptoniphilus stercorisuis]
MKGILIFNKPKGITSHDVVYILRRKTGIKRIGHTGTLDPLAEGVLPMCIGKATKVAEYISADTKEYIARLEFGYETDTYDITGTTTKTTDYIPTIEEVRSILKEFTGEILQEPPMYSALKHNGKKLYELAREGITVERKKRKITISNLEILNIISDKEIEIKVNCSSGTYIRSLVRDMGIALNSLCTMTALKRTQVGNYKIEDSITKEELDLMSLEELEEKIISMDTALSDLEEFILPEWFYNRAINGVQFILKKNVEEKLYRVYCNNEFLGIGEVVTKDSDQRLKIKKLLL